MYISVLSSSFLPQKKELFPRHAMVGVESSSHPFPRDNSSFISIARGRRKCDEKEKQAHASFILDYASTDGELRKDRAKKRRNTAVKRKPSSVTVHNIVGYYISSRSCSSNSRTSIETGR